MCQLTDGQSRPLTLAPCIVRFTIAQHAPNDLDKSDCPTAANAVWYGSHHRILTAGEAVSSEHKGCVLLVPVKLASRIVKQPAQHLLRIIAALNACVCPQLNKRSGQPRVESPEQRIGQVQGVQQIFLGFWSAHVEMEHLLGNCFVWQLCRQTLTMY